MIKDAIAEEIIFKAIIHIYFKKNIIFNYLMTKFSGKQIYFVNFFILTKIIYL